jgi:4-hydroxythreonine-4-phosphate dehydrogenase
MIYVTQGHEKGIGLEIFFRSLVFFTKTEQQNITLIIEEKELAQYRSFLTTLEIKVIIFGKSENSQTIQSLILALEKISSRDILITLPTSKDQMNYKNRQYYGYTDFFRDHFKQELPMCFKYNSTYYAILTDHIPFKNVSNEIDLNKTQIKINLLKSGIKKYFSHLDDIYMTGLNPHCGEGGLFGDEEQKVHNQLKNIDKLLSADAHHNYLNQNSHQLFIFNYHDQGLVAFKQQHGFVGINITFGMPFLRLSVDHGTNFGQYKKNISNISGITYVMNEAMKLQKSL